MGKRGKILRPCVRCGKSVRYELWDRPGRWHWVNSDGSHHRCSDVSKEELRPQIASPVEISRPDQSEEFTTHPNHSHPLWNRTDVAPWDESLGAFSYT